MYDAAAVLSRTTGQHHHVVVRAVHAAAAVSAPAEGFKRPTREIGWYGAENDEWACVGAGGRCV